MNISPETIRGNPENNHLLTLHYNEMIPFVMDYLKKRTLPVFISLLALISVTIAMVMIRMNVAGSFPLINIIIHSFTGLIVLPLLYILPHEFLHIIPYRISGARDIRIGANWKEAYFYVTAHNHPVKRGWFMIIALTPAITITAIIVTVLLNAAPLWQWSLICSLFVHTTMCAGDLALINYFYINRHKTMVTWDDVEKGEAYFYELA
jgi:hypothetical protein